MEKDILDYEWDWDASFFGRGLCLNMEFDRKLKCPVPEIIDPMTWLRDPHAKSVNGDRKGRGAMRHGGREILLSKDDMDKAGIYFNYKDLKADSGDVRSLLDANMRARAMAQGLGDPVSKFENLTGTNVNYRALEWFTIYKGKKIVVTLAENRKRVIRYSEIQGDFWPINDRVIYPISHDWDGVSIPDLVEDKQRARSVLQNLGIKGIKLGLHPTYLYDTNKIKNRGNLTVDFNKHIPVDGNPTGSIQEIQRQAVKQEVNWIMEVLDTAAQKATATPDIQQGVQSEKSRPLGETNLIASKVDTRYSLAARIFGWSEKRFWKQYYQLYKQNFENDIDDKVIRIVGAMGSKWRKLTKENIIANTDPDVKVESKNVSDAIKYNELQQYRLFLKDVLAIDPQNSNARFALRKIGRLSGFSKDEVDQVLPPTIDEMNADDENKNLDINKIEQVEVSDDDFIHMVIHNKATDTPAKYAHIEAHKKAMMLKRVKPEFDMARNRPDNPEEAGAAGSPGVSFANMAGQKMSGRPLPTGQ